MNEGNKDTTALPYLPSRLLRAYLSGTIEIIIARKQIN